MPEAVRDQLTVYLISDVATSCTWLAPVTTLEAAQTPKPLNAPTAWLSWPGRVEVAHVGGSSPRASTIVPSSG